MRVAGQRQTFALLLSSALVTVFATAPISAQVSQLPQADPPPLPAQGTGSASAQSANADRIAQVADADGTESPMTEIVVTGSSIRGVPPTGSNLIQLGADEVVNTGAATTQELLSNVPQLGTFNQAPRPDQRSNGIISTAPNIRGIGQAQTLVLVNGHRLVGVGHLQNIPDPSIVPPSAIQRVEIVADGASSIYGSDGIAGVVNVITRRDYEGLSGTFRVGLGDSYRTLNANVVTGNRWDGGGVMVSAEYSKNSRLRARDRDFLSQDYSAQGGRDNRAVGNACTPATYRNNTTATGGPTGSFIQPATGAIDPRCDNFRDGDLYPRQERLSFFGAGHHQVTGGVELFADAFYSTTNSDAFRPEGSLYASGTMTRANPFFPTSVPANVPSITAYYNVNQVFGIPERDTQKLSVYGGTIGADVTLPADFRWSTYLTGSRSQTDLREGSFNSAASTAGLVATTPGTAIDPFGGRTAPSTQITLADWQQRYFSKQYIWELNSKVDGTLFQMPGGDLKVAIGGVYRREQYDGLFLNGRVGFREGVGAQIGNRTVYSGFGELFVPIFGEDNAQALLRRLDISLSARYDHYNDFGSTTNPKIGINWVPVDGVTFRGSYGTSFHAPALPDLFGPDTRAGYVLNGLLPPGQPQGSVPGGIFIAGGNPNLDAETATTWSLGADLAPEGIPGLRASLTYYNIKFKGRIAFPSSAFFYVDPAFDPYFVSNIVCGSGTYPSGTGCVSQPIDPARVFELIQGLALQNFPSAVNGPGDLPAIYSVTILRRANLAQINTQGLDFDVSYRWTMGDWSLGTQVQGNYVLNYDQSAAPGSAFLSQFPFGQQRLRIRGQVNGRTGPLTAVATVNYNDDYQNRYNLPDNTLSVETIGSYTTIDLHVGYDLPEVGLLNGTELTVDVDNLFDEDPPFARSAFGYGVGNVLGRVVTLGIRKTF